MRTFASLALLLAIIAHALASCYSPAIADCQYSCGFGEKPCPEELVCNSENKCVTDFFVTCGPGPPPPPDDGGPLMDSNEEAGTPVPDSMLEADLEEPLPEAQP